MAAYEVLLLNTAVPQIQAAQSGDTYVVPRDIAFSAALTLSAGTANGVPYLSSPGKVLTTGSALTFDGTNLFTVAAATPKIRVSDSGLAADFGLDFYFPSVASSYGQVTLNGATGGMRFVAGKAGSTGYYQAFELNGSEQMRLTSTGLGIGTNNPGQKLHVVGASGSGDVQIGTNAGANQYQYITFGGSNGGTDFGWQIGRSSNTSGIGGNGALYFYDIKANANRMSIDSSGNLGLGVTPSAWGASRSAIETGALGYLVSSGSQMNVGQNNYFNGTDFIYKTTGAATIYQQISGAHYWNIAASGTAGNAISFTQALTLSSNSPFLTGTNLESGSNSFAIGTTGAAILGFFTNNTERARISSDGTFRVKGAGTAGTTDAVQFSGSAPASAMTLDASGNLGVGTSTPTGAGGKVVEIYSSGSISELHLTNSTSGNTGLRGLTHILNGVDAYAFNRENGAYIFGTNNTEKARITSGGNFQTSSGGSVQVGGTAARATTAGTNRLDIFDGTAPVGTLANGVSFYSTAGEARVMDAAGNATLLSPHDTETNEWIFHSKHTPTGKVLRIDVERLLKFVNDHFGLDAVQEFIEE